MFYHFFYFPLGTEDQNRSRPWVTWGLLAALVGVHLYLRFVSPESVPSWVLRTDAPSLSQALTACFVHGNWFHLITNLLFLWTFGPALEDRVGPLAFLGFYLAGGLVAMGCQVEAIQFFRPEAPPIGVLGASGSVAAVLGLFWVRCSFLRIRVGHATMALIQGVTKAGITPIPGWLLCLGWVLTQVIYTLITESHGSGGTAYWAHLGGLVFGLLLGFVTPLYRQGRREKVLWRARRFLVQGKFHRSLDQTESYCHRYGLDGDALRIQARSLQLLGMAGEAESAYAKAFEVSMREGDWDEALSIEQECSRMKPPPTVDVRLLFALAEELEADGEVMDALRLFERAGNTSGMLMVSVKALERAGDLACFSLGDLDRAASLYLEAATQLETADEPVVSSDERIRTLRRRSVECRRRLEKATTNMLPAT